ncbi:hypothetical protein K2X85_01055 [bacterium]|nr:hypothetical protein [bacterium]
MLGTAEMISILLSCLCQSPVSSAAPPSPRPAALDAYQVEGWIVVEPHPALSPMILGRLRSDVQGIISRTVGEAWQGSFLMGPATLRHRLPDQPVSLEEKKLDKLLIARIRWDARRRGTNIRVQEYDFAAKLWGAEVTRQIDSERSLAEGVVDGWLACFRATAQIVGKTRGIGEISVRGSSLVSGSSSWKMLSDRTVFEIFRQKEDNSDEPTTIPWSYLMADAVRDGSGDRIVVPVEIASLFRDPLTRRSRSKIKLWAMAIPEEIPAETRVTFQTRPGNRPIVGYEVAIKPWRQSATYSMGTTNFRGEQIVTVPEDPRNGTSRVVEVLLLSGATVIARFPLVPGSPAKLTAQAPIDPLLAEISGRMLSVQEEIVDQSARRKILEWRLKKAASQDELEKTKALAVEINDLPTRSSFQDRVNKIREEADNRSKELKQPRLGLAVSRLFLQTDRLIESIPQEKLVIDVTPTPSAP